MHPGPCSIRAGLSADGGVEAAMEAPGSTGQPLRSLKCGGYPSHTFPVGAAGRYVHAIQDEWDTGARDTSVLKDCRCLAAAGSAVSTYMTGVSGSTTRGGPADAGRQHTFGLCVLDVRTQNGDEPVGEITFPGQSCLSSANSC